MLLAIFVDSQASGKAVNLGLKLQRVSGLPLLRYDRQKAEPFSVMPGSRWAPLPGWARPSP